MLSDSLIKKLKSDVRDNLKSSIELYRHFHANAELSGQEAKTAARVAQEFKRLSIPVTTDIGGHGVVGLLENGPGPTIMLRADMDALPVKEDTGLEYACQAVGIDQGGKETPIMHACGHDIHTTVLVGVAKLLAGLKDQWQGRVVLLAQPAEEGLNGAQAMMDDGLWKRFPRPDAGMGLHVDPELATGTISLTPGYVSAGAESLDLIIKGVGGHGAYPHKTKDPVVLAAQIILALQTVVSRGTDPREMAVITAGSIHGGTKRNIIGEEVSLGLTVRTFTPEVMTKTVADIRRIAAGLARAMDLPEDRLPSLNRAETSLPPVYNDPDLAERMKSMFEGTLGEDNVTIAEPSPGSEDFGQLGEADPPFPLFFFMIGATDQARLEEAREKGVDVPLLHTPRFYPDSKGTLETGLTTMSAAALEFLKKD